MSTMAVLDERGTLVGADELVRDIRRNLQAAREDRKRFEPTWHSNLAFASGKFWLKWDRNQRKLAFPPELTGRELYSTDVMTEYRTTALGELGSDDDRPQLLLRRDDRPSEDFMKQLNRAVAFGWDYEWDGDRALEEMRRLCIDLGTTAIRCRFDPTKGPVIADNVPHVDGVPVLNEEQARELLAGGPRGDVTMGPVRQGKICWEPLSAFNLLVPPGIPEDRDFPWEGVIRPARLDEVRAEYGNVAADLREDTDIFSILGLDTQSDSGEAMNALSYDSGRTGRLKEHVWLFTYYERPSPKFSEGRTIVFGGNKMKPLRVTNRLPYVSPDGTPSSGLVYFHWWRVTGRFWSRGLVEAMKDPQRIVNKRRTQINDIIDRGLPAVFVERNSRAKERRGLAVELIELDPQERLPQETRGISPGEWMYHDVQEMRADIEHATGIRGPRLGENPTNVTTYSQLALLLENDQSKRQQIMREHARGRAKLVEASVYDMRTYWGPERTITLASEEDYAEAVKFNATKIPAFFIVKVAKGATQPRSQAAELKKIEDLFGAVIQTQAFISNPHDWVKWLKDSLEQGQALDLPQGGVDAHSDKAALENSLMIEGQEPPVQYYDPAPVHIPIHREAQIQAELVGDIQLWQRIENHVQKHVLMAQAVAAQMQSMMPPPPLPELPIEGGPGGQSQGARPAGPGGGAASRSAPARPGA